MLNTTINTNQSPISADKHL